MNHKEPVMYVIMGVSATIFNWIIYALFVRVMPMELANAFSWGGTLVFAYITNKLFVFDSWNFEKRVLFKEFSVFATARGITGVLEIVLLPQMYALGLKEATFGIHGMQAKIAVCLIMVVVNYFCTKRMVFVNSNEKSLTNI